MIFASFSETIARWQVMSNPVLKTHEEKMLMVSDPKLWGQSIAHISVASGSDFAIGESSQGAEPHPWEASQRLITKLASDGVIDSLW